MKATRTHIERNIELSKEVERLKDEVNRISFLKDKEYKKLWGEHQKVVQKLDMINQFTQNLTEIYPCG